jgi:hypothetical protein
MRHVNASNNRVSQLPMCLFGIFGKAFWVWGKYAQKRVYTVVPCVK